MKPAMARRFVVIGIFWCPESSLSNRNEMVAGFPTLAGVTLTMLPTTLLPCFIRIPEDNGTSCIILPVMTCPGLELEDEIVEFSRTGSIVPAGIALLSSGGSGCTDCAGRVSGCAHDNVSNINSVYANTPTLIGHEN